MLSCSAWKALHVAASSSMRARCCGFSAGLFCSASTAAHVVSTTRIKGEETELPISVCMLGFYSYVLKQKNYFPQTIQLHLLLRHLAPIAPPLFLERRRLPERLLLPPGIVGVALRIPCRFTLTSMPDISAGRVATTCDCEACLSEGASCSWRRPFDPWRAK